MTLLSINLNKFALLRNARGEDRPNLIEICKKCIQFGAEGITVHPRPDERHTKYSDLLDLKKIISHFNNIEYNIEGYPSNDFLNHIIDLSPDQITLVPDPPEALTSSFGWDCQVNKSFLQKIVKKIQSHNIRVSLFVNPSISSLQYLNEINPDRVELYTYDYAKNFKNDKFKSIEPYKEVGDYINSNFPNILLNAGHDLNLDNLKFILDEIPNIQEVSIGHALVCDSLIYGLENTVKKYSSIVKLKKI